MWRVAWKVCRSTRRKLCRFDIVVLPSARAWYDKLFSTCVWTSFSVANPLAENKLGANTGQSKCRLDDREPARQHKELQIQAKVMHHWHPSYVTTCLACDIFRPGGSVGNLVNLSTAKLWVRASKGVKISQLAVERDSFFVS